MVCILYICIRALRVVATWLLCVMCGRYMSLCIQGIYEIFLNSTNPFGRRLSARKTRMRFGSSGSILQSTRFSVVLCCFWSVHKNPNAINALTITASVVLVDAGCCGIGGGVGGGDGGSVFQMMMIMIIRLANGNVD